MKENEEIKLAAKNNSYDNYRYSFTPRLNDYVVENIEVGEEIIKLLENPEVLAFIDEF